MTGGAYYYTDCPKVSSINQQRLLKLGDIPPNNYKNVYLKTKVTKDMNMLDSTNLDMKVRWKVPVN